LDAVPDGGKTVRALVTQLAQDQNAPLVTDAIE